MSQGFGRDNLVSPYDQFGGGGGYYSPFSLGFEPIGPGAFETADDVLFRGHSSGSAGGGGMFAPFEPQVTDQPPGSSNVSTTTVVTTSGSGTTVTATAPSQPEASSNLPWLALIGVALILLG